MGHACWPTRLSCWGCCRVQLLPRRQTTSRGTLLVSQQIVSELAPTGVLRAGINMSNFLLVSSRDAAGGPVGVAPDMARRDRQAAGRAGQVVPYKAPGELADAAETRMPGTSA